MINRHFPIDGLIAELEECLGRVDASGQTVAGAYLSSAIDSLKASIIPARLGSSSVTDPRRTKMSMFH